MSVQRRATATRIRDPTGFQVGRAAGQLVDISRDGAGCRYAAVQLVDITMASCSEVVFCLSMPRIGVMPE